MTQVNDLDKLKTLLFGDEKQALDSITHRVETPESRTTDVADILPEAIYQSHQNGDHLSVSLRAPVRECLEQAIEDDPQTYGDALYPVMGPAIRKSILETLRALAQQINEAVEQSLTPQGIKWRIQAWRAGIPFGDYILQKTLLYRVEQAYLISREDGLLIAHAHHDVAKIKDSDAVSAMFTAIQDFVKESFSPDRTGRLESADMGEFTLWAVHGPHALLVCVIRGVPPMSLRTELSSILERIHFRYGEAVRTYTGESGTVPGVEEELADCLRFEARQEPDSERRKISIPLLIVLLLVAGGLVYFIATRWVQADRIEKLAAALDATPGIYVDSVAAEGGALVVRGMRDPLAATVPEIAAAAGLESAEIEADMRPFQSLSPDLIASRAARSFGAPAGVDYAVDGTTLTVSGPLPFAVRANIDDRVDMLAGVDSVVFRATPADRVQIVTDFLSPPASIQTAAESGGVVLSGSASDAWIDASIEKLATVEPDWPVSLDSVTAIEKLELQSALEALSGTDIFFTDGTQFSEEQDLVLERIVGTLSTLRTRAADQDLNIRITLTGYTDSVGDLPTNERLADRRTETVATALRNSGHADTDIVRLRETADDQEAPEVDFNLRRVTIEFETDPVISP